MQPVRDQYILLSSCAYLLKQDILRWFESLLALHSGCHDRRFRHAGREAPLEMHPVGPSLRALSGVVAERALINAEREGVRAYMWLCVLAPIARDRAISLLFYFLRLFILVFLEISPSLSTHLCGQCGNLAYTFLSVKRCVSRCDVKLNFTTASRCEARFLSASHFL